MGGTLLGSPTVVSWGPNRLDIFVVGTNRALYHKWFDGSNWGPSLTGYEFMGGTIVGQPRVVAWGPNRLDVFVVGTNRALYHKWWNGASWGPSLTGYEAMGGIVTGFAPQLIASAESGALVGAMAR
jgi:serine protease AprX